MTDSQLPCVAAAHAPPSPADLADDVVASDVLVIGGGPAGSTAATFLARKGGKALMLEKGRHRRFHIGQSRLPMNLPIPRRGVLEPMEAIGTHKPGAQCFDLALDPLSALHGRLRRRRAVRDSFSGHTLQSGNP